MFGPALKYIKQQIDDCKSLPDVNSRMAFLSQSVVSSVGVFLLTIAFIWKGRPEDYPWMIAALAGHVGASSWGRGSIKSKEDLPPTSTPVPPADQDKG